MTTKPTRVHKLVRLNEFREDLAGASLNRALGEQSRAVDAHNEATSRVEVIGEQKFQADSSHIDLNRYAHALALEAQATQDADASEQALLARQAEAGVARSELSQRAQAVRVSTTRDRRERLSSSTAREKRQFDEVSDVWLNNRERGRD